MSNLTNMHGILVDTSRGEAVYTATELEKILNDPEQVKLANELEKIGSGKGIPFELKLDEVFTVPPKSKVLFVKRVITLSSNNYPILYVICKSDKRGEVEFPISIFRRLPILQKDMDELLVDNPLGAEMLKNGMNDLKRGGLCIGHSFQVTYAQRLPKRDWKTVNGKPTAIKAEEVEASINAGQSVAESWFYKYRITK